MRRPAPLPASPEEPTADDVALDAAPARRRWGSLRFGSDAESPSHPSPDPDAAGDADSDHGADGSSITAVIEEDDRRAVSDAVGSGEVWRAARARRMEIKLTFVLIRLKMI